MLCFCHTVMICSPANKACCCCCLRGSPFSNLFPRNEVIPTLNGEWTNFGCCKSLLSALGKRTQRLKCSNKCAWDCSLAGPTFRATHIIHSGRPRFHVWRFYSRFHWWMNRQRRDEVLMVLRRWHWRFESDVVTVADPGEVCVRLVIQPSNN